MQMDGGFDQELTAGAACAPLIADPKSWINRRVEAVELLSREETRRRVSIDFSLTTQHIAALQTRHGVVVPLSALHKEARRNFDLRDEGGRSVPVLGRDDNGRLAQIAFLTTASEVLHPDASEEDLDQLAADCRTVIFGEEDEAYGALGDFVERAQDGDRLWGPVWQNELCRELLLTLVANYILFAVIESSTPHRRVLKYSYGEYFDLPGGFARLAELAGPAAVERVMYPDSPRFLIGCPGAWRAASFHMEIAIPEELRIRTAFLVDFEIAQRVGEIDRNVDRAALYAERPLEVRQEIDAYVEVFPKRAGVVSRAATIAVAVAVMLWAGVASGLDASNPAPAVSLLLAGAALYSGMAAGSGEHLLVRRVFTTPRRWLAVAAIAALVGSVSLAMAIPTAEPVGVWRLAAIVATIAAARLGWSALRAAR